MERLIYLGGGPVGTRDGPGLSSTVLQIGGRALMVDCGIEILEENKYGFPDFDSLASKGIRISALVLTHGHLDHVGSVGLASERTVFKSGAKIYGTPQTNIWLPSVLNETWGRGVGGDYYGSINKTKEMLRVIPHGEFEILPGIPALAGSAGHVPGALYFLVRLPTGKVILFCGDNSWHDQEVVKGTSLPDDIPDRWLPDIIAVTDLTNPSLTKFDYHLEMGRLIKHVNELLSKKKIVIIAAFAYGREQNVALALARAGVSPLYADGSGVDVFRVFKDHRWSPGDREFILDGLELITVGEDGVKKGRKRAELLAAGGPLVIVSPAGFGNGGPVRQYLEQGVGNPDFEFIATSWLLPGCTMDRLIEKVKRRDETGRQCRLNLKDEESGRETVLDVKCQASHFRLSAHGGLGETKEMLHKIVARRGGKKLESVMLTHGTQESKRMASGVLGRFAESTIFVSPGTIINI